MPPNLLGLTEDQAEQLRDEERRKQKERSAIEDGDGGDGGGDEDGVEEGSFSGEAGKAGGGGDEDALLLAEEMKGLAVVEEGDEGEENGGGGSDEEVNEGAKISAWAFGAAVAKVVRVLRLVGHGTRQGGTVVFRFVVWCIMPSPIRSVALTCNL